MVNLGDFLILGVVIGSNNLAVALALGAMGQAARRFRVMLVFGVFEFLMPLLGIGLGASAARAVGLNSDAAGAGLLVAVGLLAIIGGVRNRRQDEKLAKHVTRWRGLVILALGLSTDNVVIGFSLGLGGTDPLAVATTIACFSVLFTWIGMKLGRESRRSWERVATIGAGVLLVGFGAASGLVFFKVHRTLPGNAVTHRRLEATAQSGRFCLAGIAG